MKLQHFLVCGVFGAFATIAAFVIGAALLATTGIPMIGGLLNAVVVVLILFTGIRLVNRFGAAILTNLVFVSVAIPTIVVGPPGPHKVIIGLAAGLIIDFFITIFQRKTIGYYIGIILGSAVYPLGIYFVLVYTQAPSLEKYSKIMIPFIAWYGLCGAIGTYIGLSIYNKKLSKLAAVKNLE